MCPAPLLSPSPHLLLAFLPLFLEGPKYSLAIPSLQGVFLISAAVASTVRLCGWFLPDGKTVRFTTKDCFAEVDRRGRRRHVAPPSVQVTLVYLVSAPGPGLFFFPFHISPVAAAPVFLIDLSSMAMLFFLLWHLLPRSIG